MAGLEWLARFRLALFRQERYGALEARLVVFGQDWRVLARRGKSRIVGAGWDRFAVVSYVTSW